MKRYLNIYLLLIKINFSKLFIYRAHVINSLISTFGWGMLSVIGIIFLTNRTTTVYGWTRQDLYLLAGVYTVIIGINHMLFSENFRRFSEIINKGELDGILLRPLDSQFQLSCWNINYTSFLRTIIGIVFTGIVVVSAHIQIGFFSILTLLLFTLVGSILLYSIWYILLTLIIWFTNLTNLIDFLFTFNNLARYPKEVITQSGNILLYFLFPLTLVATVPVRQFVSKASLFESLLLIFFGFGLFGVSRVFWKFALRYYGSASG